MTDRRSPIWRVLILIISALALSALVLAAACGDDDDDDSGDDDGGETATEPADGGDDDEPTDEDDGEDDGEDEPTSEDDFLGEIEGFAGEYENATGVVTYEFDDETGSGGAWTIYQDGENSRTDYDAGDDSAFISIQTPEVTYSCFDDVCYEGEGVPGANPLGGLFTAFGSSEAIYGYLDLFTDVDVEESSEEIAGTDANCFTVSGDLVSDEGTIKWCWADNGLLLLSEYDLESGGFAMRATEFSDSVPSDAFEPPFEVQSLGQ